MVARRFAERRGQLLDTFAAASNSTTATSATRVLALEQKERDLLAQEDRTHSNEATRGVAAPADKAKTHPGAFGDKLRKPRARQHFYRMKRLKIQGGHQACLLRLPHLLGIHLARQTFCGEREA